MRFRKSAYTGAGKKSRPGARQVQKPKFNVNQLKDSISACRICASIKGTGEFLPASILDLL
jgi:hypothetical protein